MYEDLDTILADQYHNAKRRLKLVKRLRQAFNYQEDLDLCERQIQLTITFYESMIFDKRLLEKKIRIRKPTDDILAKNRVRNTIKNVFAYSTLSYRMMLSYWETYMSFWNTR